MQKKRINSKIWIVVAVSVIVLVVIFFAWKSSNKKQVSSQNVDTPSSNTKPSLTVTVVQPELQNWKQNFTANGNIAAWQEVVIGSELSGQRITKVNVNVGDSVQRGQVLAEINSESIRAELATAKANYAEAKAVLADAILNNQRIQQLKNTGAISQQEATQYLTSRNTAQARLDAAKAQIDSNQLRLTQTQVIAPDHGVISARTATVGSLAQTGQELFRLIRDNRLEWRAEVTSTDLYKLAKGMTAQITSPDPSRSAVQGTVRMIAPVIDPQTRYGLVYVDIPTTDAVRMGMFVKGEFDLGQKPALTVPQTAVLLRDGFSYVFIVNKDNRVSQQKVSIGRRLNDRVEVLDLPANTRIVASGTGFLADGDLVKLGQTIPDTPLTKQLWLHRRNNMNFSAWSIKNPIPGILLFIMLGLAGLMCFHWMKIQQFPDIELPMVTVTAALPGAAPPQLETEVARKIENSIATLQGLKNQYTNIQDGVVVITAEFQLEKPLQEAVDDVRNAVSQVRSDLPADLRDPIVSKINLSGSPILTYTIQSPRMDEETLSWFVDYDIARAMLKVKGVGAVSRVGGVTRQVEVELDPEKLLALNATATDITRQLRLIQQEASGGQTKIGGSEQSIRTIATVKTAAEIGTMDIALSDGRHIRLDQVATVHDGIAERRSAALLNGHPVIGFEITRSKGASEVEVETGVKVALDQLKKLIQISKSPKHLTL